MMNRRSLVAVALVVFAAPFGFGACAETAIDLQLKYTAAQDLECDRSALEVSEETPFSRRVSGCQRELIYHRRCPPSRAQDGAWASRCQWVASRADEEELEE